MATDKQTNKQTNKQTDRALIFYITYETNTYKCSYLSTILKIQAVLAEKIKRKVYVNQNESFTVLQIINFYLNFLYELVMIF